MPLPSILTLKRLVLNDAYATFLRVTDLNFKQIEEYLKKISEYIALIPTEPTLSEEQLSNAIKNAKKVKTIPFTLLDGATLVYEDGSSVNRAANIYTLNLNTNTDNMFVTCKKTTDKTIFNCSIQTIDGKIIINLFSSLDEDIDVYYL